MPILTKEQIVEAVFELSAEEQQEVSLRIAERMRPLHLSQSQMQTVRDQLAQHDADPQGGVSWDELKARLQAKNAA